MTIAKRLIPVMMILFGAIVFYIIGTLVYMRMAHADPTVGLPPSSPVNWIGIIGAVLGGIGTVLGGLSVIGHLIAPRTKTTLDDRAVDAIDGVHRKLDELLDIAHGIGAPAATAVKPSPGTGTAVAFALLVIAISVIGIPACSLRQHGAAAAGAFLDCESKDVQAAMPDALMLAKAAIMRWIGGSGSVDMAGIKSDAAAIKGDLGRCAFDAAIAALASQPAPSKATAAAPMVVDGQSLRSSWVAVRAELAWPPQK